MNTFEGIRQWLLEQGAQYATLRELTQNWVLQMRQEGIPVDRINLGVFALHPEMAGYAVTWDTSLSDALEIPVRREDTLSPTYLQSPIRTLVDDLCELRFDLRQEGDVATYQVLEEYKAKGYLHYYGFPIVYGEDGVAALTICTKDGNGLTPEMLDAVRNLFPVLRLLMSVVETQRLAKTVLKTYLGRKTGESVLAGKIIRGQGEFIDAALWLCDLRDFTSMTEEIGSESMIDVMNDYFDCMADAVWAENGEILKFMGDAMLVVFRKNDETSTTQVVDSALTAARNAQLNLQSLSKKRAEKGLVPLKTGIAIHLGQVIYGNVGAASRLDFTVMGHAVNMVARIQQLSGELGLPVLCSQEVAAYANGKTTSLGRYTFKGVKSQVEVFKPTESTQ